MNTGELCMRDVVVAAADEPARVAAQRMIDHHVGSLVVVEGPPGARRPVGMITDRDLLQALLVDGAGHTRALTIGDLMTADLVSAREDRGVFEALETMRDRGVRRLPVVDRAGHLVGILAYDDLVEWVAESLTSLNRLVEVEHRRERQGR